MSTADDELGMSVVRGMRGIGGVCEMCMCLVGAWQEEQGGVWDVCLCLDCGGVGGEWVVSGV